MSYELNKYPGTLKQIVNTGKPMTVEEATRAIYDAVVNEKVVTSARDILTDRIIGAKSKAMAKYLCGKHNGDVGCTEVAVESGMMEARAYLDKLIRDKRIVILVKS